MERVEGEEKAGAALPHRLTSAPGPYGHCHLHGGPADTGVLRRTATPSGLTDHSPGRNETSGHADWALVLQMLPPADSSLFMKSSSPGKLGRRELLPGAHQPLKIHPQTAEAASSQVAGREGCSEVPAAPACESAGPSAGRSQHFLTPLSSLIAT